MRKLLIVFIVLAVIVGLLATFLVITPSSAFTPPNQGSDNATDVILWHGDNSTITIASANITVTDFETALTNAMVEGADEIADEMGIITSIICALIILLSIAFLAYMRSDRILLVLTGFGFIIFGFEEWTGYHYLSIILVIAGVGSFIKAWAGSKREE